MPRHVITIKDLGKETSWMLVQQALGIPDAKMQSDFMADKVALLLFFKQSLPERLCVTAAVRQMDGSTIYQGDRNGFWHEEVRNFQKHMLPIFGYYIDCLYVYGFPVTTWDVNDTSMRFPLINAGSPNAHPAHALADIACMLRKSRYLNGVNAAWIGCANGTLYSLVEAMPWFPFSLKISFPPNDDCPDLRRRVNELGVPVAFVSSPEEAIKNANFIYAGRFSDSENPENAVWTITPELMRQADENARLLLCASPIRSITIAPEILASKTSMLTRQAEYRLRIHKRILHWVFS